MGQIICRDGKSLDSASACSLSEKAENSLNLPVRHCSVAVPERFSLLNKHILACYMQRIGWLQPRGLCHLSLCDSGYSLYSRTCHTMSAAASETPLDAVTEEEISGAAAMPALPEKTKRNACISSFQLFYLE
jgi:hypothetical protein